MQFARYLVENSRAEHPVVILENEISKAGVDNRLLAQADFTVENVFAGCICCSSTAVLDNSVHQIEEQYAPEWLLIEATGMAFPDAIREVLQNSGYPNSSILALVDAKRWFRVVHAMEQFVFSQLKDADVILLNKVDLVDEETVLKIIEAASAYNPASTLEQICALNPQGELFWKKIIKALKV